MIEAFNTPGTQRFVGFGIAILKAISESINSENTLGWILVTDKLTEYC